MTSNQVDCLFVLCQSTRLQKCTQFQCCYLQADSILSNKLATHEQLPDTTDYDIEALLSPKANPSEDMLFASPTAEGRLEVGASSSCNQITQLQHSAILLYAVSTVATCSGMI